MFSLLYLQAQAQTSYWKKISNIDAQKLNAGKAIFDASFVPTAYKLFTLETDALRSVIKNSPAETKIKNISQGTLINVPLPNGGIERFRVVESSVMMPKLQAKYSNIRSYSGQGVDNPARTIRCDISAIGFHATISTVGEPTFYINPVNLEKGIYAVNARNKNDKSSEKFSCGLESSIEETIEKTTANKTTYVGNVDDGFLRTYRLALCATGKWSQASMTGTEVTTEDSINTVMANFVVYLVRANEVYERDLGIRLIYVENNDTLIFLNPATDPFGSLNSSCQKTCDARIGDANYDIGHVLDKAANNGNAGCIGCVCKTGQKGSGFTAYNNLSLVDYFVIDYWTHEMGHQVGANHTFTYSNESTSAQIEPGSGSTIMGYAGITGGTDVQPHSDDLFSAASIAQISNNFKSASLGGACAVKIANANNVPVVSAGQDYIIPISTPFQLTGTASDVDATDVMSYIWEQIDLRESPGFSSIPKSINTKGPMMRTYNYTNSTVRVIPELNTILAGSLATKFEVLPSVARELNFRFTARDNHFGGGQNASDNILVTVDAASGPFVINTANTATSWNEGDIVSINWDVANTDQAPINVSAVNIWLSVDGGNSFTIKLAEATPNDGSESVTLPLFTNLITNARIKVEAVGNIFFDINNADISIDGTLPVSWLSVSAEKSGTQSAIIKWSTANEFNNNYFEIQRSTDRNNYTTVSKQTAGSLPNGVQHYSFNDVRLPMGTFFYRIKQVDKDGKYSYSQTAQITIDANGISWVLVPNPASDKTAVLFNKQLTNVQVIVSDANGRTVFTKSETTIAAGATMALPAQKLSKGIYLVKVISNGNTDVQKLVISK